MTRRPWQIPVIACLIIISCTAVVGYPAPRHKACSRGAVPRRR